MMKIGGNIKAVLQIKVDGQVNEIGETCQTWKNELNLTGWLDLATGESKHTEYNARIEDSTHVFLCDAPAQFDPDRVDGTASRMIIKNRVYEVLLVDNPMELDAHLEIYLKYAGGKI